MNPALPVTPEQIAGDVEACARAGASLFHIHARDERELPCLDIEVYKSIARQVKKVCPDVILQLSTGARAGKEWEDRACPVRLLPEMGSFTTGSNNLPGIIYENSPKFIEFLAGVFKQTGVTPEIEIFEAGMISNALFLLKKGYLSAPLHFNFVLGAPGAMPGSVRNLCFLCDSIPADATWTVSGIGKSEIPLAAAAIAMGGHVRVGLEDNLFMPDGSKASNMKLVETVVSIADKVGRDIASPDEARQILNLEKANKDRILKMI